jgi:hypothetical protein
MSVPNPSLPIVTPDGTAVFDLQNAEDLAESLESPFQPANSPSDPAYIEKLTEALQVYSYALQASIR